MRCWRAVRLVGLILPGLLLSSCLWFSPGPDQAAKNWLRAYLAEDGNTMATLSCDAIQPYLQDQNFWLSAVSAFAQWGLHGAFKVSANLDDLEFKTVRNDGAAADVRVTGTLRVAILALSAPSSVDVTMHMVRERGKWVFCEPQWVAASQQIAATATANASPFFASPTASLSSSRESPTS